MNRSTWILWLSFGTTIAGCQGAPKMIPGYTRLQQPSGLIEVRFLAKGIE